MTENKLQRAARLLAESKAELERDTDLSTSTGFWQLAVDVLSTRVQRLERLEPRISIAIHIPETLQTLPSDPRHLAAHGSSVTIH